MKEYTVKVYINDTFWYKPGTNIQHREDGPAIEWADGDKFWFLNGKRHREDGPAVVRANRAEGFYLEGNCYSEEQYAVEMNRRNNKDSCSGKIVEIDGKKYKLTEA